MAEHYHCCTKTKLDSLSYVTNSCCIELNLYIVFFSRVFPSLFVGVER